MDSKITKEQVSDFITHVNYQSKNYALVNSPDDGGFYFERIEDCCVSQTFLSEIKAFIALERDEIVWQG